MLKPIKILTLCGALLFLSIIISSSFSGRASAAQITARRLTLQAGATDGGSKPSGVVNHKFDFTVPNAGNANIGSIKFQYCTLASGSCTTPAGLSTTSATLGTQSGATGFSINATTNGSPYITRTAASVTA